MATLSVFVNQQARFDDIEDSYDDGADDALLDDTDTPLFTGSGKGTSLIICRQIVRGVREAIIAGAERGHH